MRIQRFGVTIALLTCGANAGAQIISAKRGFADTGAGYNNLQASNAGWYYTWGTGAANPGNFDANHYPMIWNGTPSASTLTNLVSRNAKYVLGFNEPERSDQANMTPAQAVTSWTSISSAFTGTATKLVSPAVADTGGTTGGQAWLSTFMSQARAANLKVDAVAFHWYGVSTPTDPAGAASSFLDRVASYYNSYKLPVFITEFAIHDWGGIYSDAEIAEANRQFLNIVIPQLESRSYVAGYAWYQWFGDSHLYAATGSTLTPTPLSYSYIGAIGAGTTSNLAGQNLGEHVAPLTGGTLIMEGATAGTLKYVNALSGESNVAGTTNWSLAGAHNWVRIQPGARLTKSGTNDVTFDNGDVVNNGVLEVKQGTLRLGSAVTGTGSVRVSGGTLVLGNAATLNATPLIEVRPGGTLNATALPGGTLSVTNGRSLNANGTLVGNLLAGTGATVAATGSIVGQLTAQGGATIRVGTDRLGVARRNAIDNFEAYATGDVATTTSGAWTAHQSTTFADIESVNGTKALSFGPTTGFAGTSHALPAVAVLSDAQTGTYFFRVNAAADNLNHNIGLGDQANTGGVDFNDFEAQLRLKQGTTAGTFAIDARSGTAFTSTLASGLALNAWYNVWMVVDQTNDRYDVYLNNGTAAATAANKLNATPLAFRNGTRADLTAFLAYAGGVPTANAVRLDDITFQTGLDLTNPMAGFDPGYTWTPESLNVSGDYAHAGAATLQMNVGTAATTGSTMQADAINVTGNITLDGTLALEATIGFAPAYQQSRVLLHGGSLTGRFRTIAGVSLQSDLSLAVTYTGDSVLVTTALPGDADLNGRVEFDDLLALAQHYASATTETWSTGDFNGDAAVNFDDLLTLAQHYSTGAPLAAGDVGAFSNDFAADWALARSLVPEPTTLGALVAGLTTVARRTRRKTRG